MVSKTSIRFWAHFADPADPPKRNLTLPPNRRPAPPSSEGSRATMALVTIPNAPEGVVDPSALWRLAVTVDERNLRFKVRVSPNLARAFEMCPALAPDFTPSSRLADPPSALTPQVPCGDGTLTVAELMRKVTERIRRLQPNVSVTVERLTDADGSLLFPEDRVCDVLENRGGVRARVDASSTSVQRYTTAPPGKQKKRAAGTLVSPPYARDDARYEYVTPSSADILSGTAPRVAKFACPVCDKGFAQCQQLVFHVKSHKRETMSRAHQQAVDAAVRSMHNTAAQATDSPATKERRFFCPSPACEHNPEVDPGAHPFKDFANCRQHYLRRHTNEKPFKCPKCDRAYAVKPDMQTHAKQCGMQYPCSCGAWFNLARDLRAHVKSQGGDHKEKPAVYKPDWSANLELPDVEGVVHLGGMVGGRADGGGEAR